MGKGRARLLTYAIDLSPWQLLSETVKKILVWGLVMTTQFRLPDDFKNTLAKDQWWLFNSGQGVANNTVTPGTPGIDINVLPLWPQYTGKGIKVGVIDDGVDGQQHKDLKDNFDQQNSIDPVPGEKDSHGTNVAGVIAAQRNTSGTVGIAYEAKISGYKNGNAVIIATLNK